MGGQESHTAMGMATTERQPAKKKRSGLQMNERFQAIWQYKREAGESRGRLYGERGSVEDFLRRW